MHFVSHNTKVKYYPLFIAAQFIFLTNLGVFVISIINYVLAEHWTVNVSLLSSLVRAAQSGIWWGAG